MYKWKYEHYEEYGGITIESLHKTSNTIRWLIMEDTIIYIFLYAFTIIANNLDEIIVDHRCCNFDYITQGICIFFKNYYSDTHVIINFIIYQRGSRGESG